MDNTTQPPPQSLSDDRLHSRWTHPQTLQVLNNFRLFLQVTTLAKVTNHASTHILPETLHQNQLSPTLASISVSNYNWPTQPNPSSSAWKIWTKVLQEQYTKPGPPTMLQQPLRPWTPQAATVRTWLHTFDPSTNQIITQVPNIPMLHHLPQHHTCHHVYYTVTGQMSNLIPTWFLSLVRVNAMVFG